MNPVKIAGGGLAGCEAAWQIARRGHKVVLFEMRPGKSSPAHRTGKLAELVCSNSLKSVSIDRASGLLKEEMRLAGSLILEAAQEASIPGGSSLIVDRTCFSKRITGIIEGNRNIRTVREEFKEIPADGPVVIATGPMTSAALSTQLANLIGKESLYFYDAIAPTVDAETINWDRVFIQDRYAQHGTGVYVNCPLDKKRYTELVNVLRAADPIKPHHFEDLHHFEACMPVEELAARGDRTLSFGPLRPVGLVDPKTGRRPYAVVQLRPENSAGSLYSMVGFQTRLSFTDQLRILRMIPGLENAKFERMGTIHRNTYVDAPGALDLFQRVRTNPDVFLSGQVAGVEGYLESAASGLMTGIYISNILSGFEPAPPPATTMVGAILGALSSPAGGSFQPVNAQYGLLTPLPDPRLRKEDKRKGMAERAIRDMRKYLERIKV